MCGAEYGTPCLPTPVAVAAYAVSFLLLLVLFIYRHMPQEGREKQRQRRGKKGDARGFVLRESLQLSETSTHSPICPKWDGTYEAVHQLEKAVKVLETYLDRLSCETPEDSDDSWTTSTASTLGTSPQESLISLVDEANLQIQQSAPDVHKESKLPDNVNVSSHGCPTPAPPTPQRPEKHHVMSFLDESVRSELEHHIQKLKIQRRYGLHQRIFDCENGFEKVILR